MLKKKVIFVLSLGIMLGVFIGLSSSVFAERGTAENANDAEPLPMRICAHLQKFLAGLKGIM